MSTTSGSAVAFAQRGRRINWIVLLIVGALTAALGLFLLFRPSAVTRLLVQGVGIYWLIVGLVELLGTLSDRGMPMRRLRLLGAAGAVLSGALVLMSMLAGQVIAPTLMRYIVAFTALVMGVLNIWIGMNRSAPSRGRQILGAVYALLGIVLLVDPAVVPTLVLPVIGVLLAAAGGYVVYLAYRGREEGTVVLGPSTTVISPEAQKQALLDQTRADVAQITQQAKESDLGAKKGP